MAESMFADLAAKVFAEVTGGPQHSSRGAVWQAVEASGLPVLLLPENKGGAGDVFSEATEVMIALGASGANLPLADTIIANRLADSAGLEASSLPKAILLEPEARGSLASSGGRTAWSGKGVCHWAGFAGEAIGLVELPDGKFGVAEMDLSAATRTGESLSGSPLAWLETDRPLPIRRCAAAPSNAGSEAVALAALLASAEMVGAMERACEMTIEYANTRRQFGRAISKFQAIQHMTARMASEAAASRAAVEFAASQFGSGNPLWGASCAKARASEAAGIIAAGAHQIHGAIGFTREYQLHRHTCKLLALRERSGSETYWNEKISAALLNNKRDEMWACLVEGLVI